ncbi:MAG: hypothetical protein BWY83_01777 [bacterium ADurb.Bin478]|nr:MAG: hypothetical protein BWY83_01777 [bacterium ADurb.Bin478]
MTLHQIHDETAGACALDLQLHAGSAVVLQNGVQVGGIEEFDHFAVQAQDLVAGAHAFLRRRAVVQHRGDHQTAGLNPVIQAHTRIALRAPLPGVELCGRQIAGVGIQIRHQAFDGLFHQLIGIALRDVKALDLFQHHGKNDHFVDCGLAGAENSPRAHSEDAEQDQDSRQPAGPKVVFSAALKQNNPPYPIKNKNFLTFSLFRSNLHDS